MEILSERKLAERLHVSPWTVRNWRLKDGLPHVKTDTGRIHYSMESVQLWWDKRETAGQEKMTSVSGIRQIN